MLGSDRLMVVSFPGPWRYAAPPVVVRDLLAGDTWIAEGGSPQFTPGERETGNIVIDHPYAGEMGTLDRHLNGRLTVGLRVMGVDPAGEADRIVAGCLAPGVEVGWWRADGPPTFYPVRGDVGWEPGYAMRGYRAGAGLAVGLVFEVAPFAHRGSMDIYDGFDVDTLSDYGQDA